tara:strand:- start:8162 stop:9115 length:954 start_codon:yes stop_codon:yes gene_type:complete
MNVDFKQKFFRKFISKIFLIYLKNIFFFLSITYLCYSLLFNVHEIKFQIEKENYIYLLISLIFSLLSIFFNGIAWSNIVIWFGQRKKIKDITSFFIASNSLKYVPGSIWHFIERFNFLKKKTNNNFAFYATVIEPYFMLSAGLLLSSFGVFFNTFYLIFIVPSFFLHRDLIYSVIKKLSSLKNKVLKKSQIPKSKSQFDAGIKITSNFPFKVLLIEIMFIVFKYLGYISCFYIFNKESINNNLFIFTNFCLAWSIGLIIPAAPGGVGVFEACFLFLLRNIYSPNLIIISLIYFRFITVFADLFLSSPFFIKKIFPKN